MSETTDISKRTEQYVKDVYKSTLPILMKPVNQSLTSFINNTLRLIAEPQQRENVKRQVSIKAHKYATYLGKSMKSLMGDFPPVDLILTVKSLSQLGVFMISEINNLLLTASLFGISPKVKINLDAFTPLFDPVLNFDITVMESVHKRRDEMIEKSVSTIRTRLQERINGDPRKIDVLMDTIFVPFITIFLTELFKTVFVDFKNPSGDMEPPTQKLPPPPQPISATPRTIGGKGASRKPRKQKKRLITKSKSRTSKNTKTKSRRRR